MITTYYRFRYVNDDTIVDYRVNGRNRSLKTITHEVMRAAKVDGTKWEYLGTVKGRVF